MERLVDKVEVVTVSESLTDKRRSSWKRTLAGAVADNGMTVEAGTDWRRPHTPAM
jgi:hypothetical protein